MDDRHYVCEQCGVKWFVPATRTARADELRCGECNTPLTPRDEPFSARDGFLSSDPSVGS